MTIQTRPGDRRSRMIVLLLAAAGIAAAASYIAGREIGYSLLGTTTTAKVIGSRTGIVRYSFQESNGRQRTERDDVHRNLSFGVDGPLDVEYIPGLMGFSRMRGNKPSPSQMGFLFVYAAIFSAGAWLVGKGPFAKSLPEKSIPVIQATKSRSENWEGEAPTESRTSEQHGSAGASPSRNSGSRTATKPQLPETKSPTMSEAEVVGCSVAGVVGTVLIGISLLGGFGHASGVVFMAVVIGFVALFAIVMSNRNASRRTYALRKFAKQLHLEFAHAGNEKLHQSLERFHLATLGHTSIMTNLMFGKQDGTDIAVFDYKYFRGKNHFRQTVIWMQRRGATMTQFALRPESVWNRLGPWVAHGDINFESHPEFSRSYLLRGDNQWAICELFTDDVLRFYEQHPGLITEGSGNKLLFYRDEAVVKPENIRSFLDEALAVRSLFQPTTER